MAAEGGSKLQIGLYLFTEIKTVTRTLKEPPLVTRKYKVAIFVHCCYSKLFSLLP